MQSRNKTAEHKFKQFYGVNLAKNCMEITNYIINKIEKIFPVFFLQSLKLTYN